MTDHIQVVGIRAFGHHGVLPAERRDGQEFVVDLDLELDLARAAQSDDLADTVDYATLATRVVGVVSSDPVDLIETLADRLASMVLTEAQVDAVTVTVHKPHAPVGVPFADVAVSLRRSRR
ncbi:MAG: dihydroneopterin aldolase [Actinomycetes bacterium]